MERKFRFERWINHSRNQRRLVGGYYDAGDNIKFHFSMAFSMTLLIWSVTEYGHKYKANGEYEHVRRIIQWGTKYLLKTFNSTSTNIDKFYSQVKLPQYPMFSYYETSMYGSSTTLAACTIMKPFMVVWLCKRMVNLLS